VNLEMKFISEIYFCHMGPVEVHWSCKPEYQNIQILELTQQMEWFSDTPGLLSTNFKVDWPDTVTIWYTW